MRAVQGVGGAVMFAVSLALLAQEFPPGRERATAMGIYGASMAVAAAIGPLLGGVLTDGLGWRSIFFINVPIGAAAMAVTRLRLRETRDPGARGVDWAGVVTFSGALFALVLALVRGNAEGWGSALIVSLFAAAVVLLVGFVMMERRAREPMLPLGLFRLGSCVGVQIAAFAVAAAPYALFLYTSLYLQSYLGYSPLQTGLRYLPITIASLLAALVAGAVLSRLPARVLMSASLALTGVGLLLMAGVRSGDHWTALLAGFLVVGAGAGFLTPVVADVALGVVPKERSGMAAGINDTFRQVGVAVGVAVWGAIFLGRGAAKTAALAAGTPLAGGDNPRRLVEAASSGNIDNALAAVPGPLRSVAARAAREGFLAGFNDVLALGAAVCFAGAALALWLVREREIEPRPELAAVAEPRYQEERYAA